MVQLHLLELAQKQFPNLDFDHEEDIIRVEKILKAEAKLNADVKINDIENLITFLRTYKGRFIPILKNKNVGIIVAGKRGNVNFAPFNRENITEETLQEFEQAFSANVAEFLKGCVRNNKWNSLKSIFIHYNFLVGDTTRDELYEILKLKNQSIISAINNNQFVEFVHANPYASEIQYYTVLSTVDQHFFDDDILLINNVVCENQKTTVNKKIYLGKILYAASYFNAFSDGLKETLDSNQQIALQWIYPHENMSSDTGSTTSTTTTVIIIIAVALLIIFSIASGTPRMITPVILVISVIARIINAARK